MSIKYKKAIYAALLSLAPFLSFGQTNSSSPYSMFGVGDIANSGFGRNRAMGGVSSPLISPYNLNPLNPANYVALPANTFVFEFGMSMNNYQLKTADDTYSDINGNINYLAAGFPIAKWWKSGIGMQPLSSIGYDIVETVTLENDLQSVVQSYTGEGGINSFYFDNSFKIAKPLSLGVKVGYIFGSLDRTRTSRMYSDSISNSSSLITETNRAIFDAVSVGFGLHFHQQVTENIFLNIGATYNLETKLSGKEESLKTNSISLDNGISLTQTIDEDIPNNGTITLPQNYGIGASVLLKQKLELAVDYQTEKWSESKFFGENQNFYDNQRISAGLEFIPDFSSTKYLNIVRYRAGFNLTNSYLMVNDKRLKQIGVSAGLGLPLRSGTIINLGFIYTNKSIPGDDVLTEHNFQFHLNLSFKANWFRKIKFL